MLHDTSDNQGETTVDALTVAPHALVFEMGGAVQSVGTGEDATTWGIAPAGIATLSSTTGSSITVTPVAVGRATITATLGDKTDICMVVVTEAAVKKVLSIQFDSVVLPALGATASDTEIAAGQVHYSFEGQPPKVSHFLRGWLYYEGAERVAITAANVGDFRTIPAVLGKDHIGGGPATGSTATPGEATPVEIYVYHVSNPSLTYPVQLPGVVALDDAATPSPTQAAANGSVVGPGVVTFTKTSAWVGEFYQDQGWLTDADFTGINVTGYYQSLTVPGASGPIFEAGPQNFTLSSAYTFDGYYEDFDTEANSSTKKQYPYGIEPGANDGKGYLNILISKGVTLGPESGWTHGGTNNETTYIKVAANNYFWIRNVEAMPNIVWRGGPTPPNNFWWPDETNRGLQTPVNNTNNAAANFGTIPGTSTTRRAYWNGILAASDITLQVYYEGVGATSAVVTRGPNYFKRAYEGNHAGLTSPPDLQTFVDEGEPVPEIRAFYYYMDGSITGGQYANEIKGLTVPLANWVEVGFDRIVNTGQQNPNIKIYAPKNPSNSSEVTALRQGLLQSIKDTYRMWGAYTHPDTGAALTREIADFADWDSTNNRPKYYSWYDWGEAFDARDEAGDTEVTIDVNSAAPYLDPASYITDNYTGTMPPIPVTVALPLPN